MRIYLLLVLFLSGQLAFGQTKHPSQLRFEGIRIWVDDLPLARDFYTRMLGFSVIDENLEKQTIKLQTGTIAVYLSKASSRNKSVYGQHIKTSLTLQVPKLLPAIDALRNAGVKIEELHLQRNGVGISIPFRDPAGNLLSLMEVQVRPVAPFHGFKIYNAGITTSAMDKAMAFYIDQLSFQEWSRDYLPTAMPLKHEDESFAFMLHEKPNLTTLPTRYGIDSNINLIFSAPDLKMLESFLKEKGIRKLSTAISPGLVFADPFGNYCEVIEPE